MTRSETILDAWEAVAHPVVVGTIFGTVTIVRVEGTPEHVDVWLSETSGAPAYRIVHPPLRTAAGIEDEPIAALAEVIGSLGGAAQTRRRTR